MKRPTEILCFLYSALILFSSGFSCLAYAANSAASFPDAQNLDEGQLINIELSKANLVNQFGDTVDLYDDVFEDRIVAVDFVFTSCATICPLITAIFSKLQQQLDADNADEIRLATFSLNPVNDTPAKLHKYSERFNNGPDWMWLTGEKQTINQLLNEFGVYSADFTSHPPIVFVGDAKRGLWTRFNGLPSPEQIKTRIHQLLAIRKDN
ncbi:MAG: SCO family protein [Gammaproteobacteria bacterium]